MSLAGLVDFLQEELAGVVDEGRLDLVDDGAALARLAASTATMRST